MEHRIRAAALIICNGKLLLVKHVHPKTGSVFWVPPGGGVNAGLESLYECAAREVYEETGLRVTLGRIVYVREFVDLEFDRHHVEIYILATGFEGDLTTANLLPEDPDFQYIREVRFLSPEEMSKTTVFPLEIKEQFWSDIAANTLATKYLGLQAGDSSKLPTG